MQEITQQSGRLLHCNEILSRSDLQVVRVGINQWLANQYRSAPGLMVAVLFIAGILFWGSFNWSLELSNTETFCISCHEMRENVYKEYRQSVHFSNSSGVRATCPDCHVPKDWKDKVIRKIGASNELFHKIIGSIDTREKFLAKRLELAEFVWNTMESNDSTECRNCHELESMDRRQQSSFASQAHQKAERQQMTCIDCHKGVAHQLPEEFLDLEHERFEKENVECSNCHEGLRHDGGWDDDE
jgi:cytochrome c-type protein NapC